MAAVLCYWSAGIVPLPWTASAVFNFVTRDMWTGLIDFLVSTGWRVLQRQIEEWTININRLVMDVEIQQEEYILN